MTDQNSRWCKAVEKNVRTNRARDLHEYKGTGQFDVKFQELFLSAFDTTLLGKLLASMA